MSAISDQIGGVQQAIGNKTATQAFQAADPSGQSQLQQLQVAHCSRFSSGHVDPANSRVDQPQAQVRWRLESDKGTSGQDEELSSVSVIPTVQDSSEGRRDQQVPAQQQQHGGSVTATGGASQRDAGAATTSQQSWVLGVAAQTTQGMRDRMSAASDQLNISIRQLYASASNIADTAASGPPSYHNIPGIVPYYHGRSSGPPPSYDDVINPYAPPPTYQSLFGQMREARKTSRGLVDLLRRLLIILVSTLGCTILIAFMILIPFTMIIVGAVYIDECRVEHIPAFLLVGGLVWASKNIIHCHAQCKQPSNSSSRSVTDTNPSVASINLSSRTGGSDERLSSSSAAAEAGELDGHNNRQRSQNLKSSICESLLNCVLLGWFVAGCVIVFRNYEPDFDNQDSVRYCHRTVYMYTFWLITSAIVVFGLFIGCICCLMVSSAIASRQEEEELG